MSENDMKIMVKQYANGAPGTPQSIGEARAAFEDTLSQWFGEFGSKIVSSHCLRVKPERVYWSTDITKYVRTADLVWEASTDHGPTAPDRILVHDAVEYVAEWKNRADQ